MLSILSLFQSPTNGCQAARPPNQKCLATWTLSLVRFHTPLRYTPTLSTPLPSQSPTIGCQSPPCPNLKGSATLLLSFLRYSTTLRCAPTLATPSPSQSP